MLANDSGSILKSLQPGQEMTLAGNIVRKKAVKQEMKPMVKVEITKDTKGSIDGININEYKADQVCTIPKWLAEGFFSMKVAKPYGEDPQPKEAKPQPDPQPKDAVVKHQPSQNKSTHPKANKQKEAE